MVASLALVTVVVAGGYLGFRHYAGDASANVGPTTQPPAAVAKTEPAPGAAAPKPAAAAAALPDDVERLASAIAVQQTLRAQLALYRLMHRDEQPDLLGKGWEQITRRTKDDGTISDKGACGPYLLQKPVNPMNGLSLVAAAVIGADKNELPTAGAGKPGAGFLFERSTGRLWMTDAGGVRALDVDAAERTVGEARQRRTSVSKSSESELSSGGKRALLASRLTTIRQQLELYNLQHNNVPPDLVKYPGWLQLYKKTRHDGTVDPAGKFGPYLLDKCPNPLNGSSAVMVVDKMPAAGSKARGGKAAGYFYEKGTGLLGATDEHGALVHDDSLKQALARRKR
jgi:hypothetical protein